jgi:hypothetical protein
MLKNKLSMIEVNKKKAAIKLQNLERPSFDQEMSKRNISKPWLTSIPSKEFQHVLDDTIQVWKVPNFN